MRNIVDNDEISPAVLRAIRDYSWMVRRKDTITFESESHITLAHSFDFTIPRDLRFTVDGNTCAVVPLGFWQKAPGHYSRIDFMDEDGRSLPLSTSTDDEAITIEVMLAYAEELLAIAGAEEMTLALAYSITFIVTEPALAAYAEFKNVWKPAATDPLSIDDNRLSTEEMAILAKDTDFMALLEVCAVASLFTVTLHDRLDQRRIVKLKYEEIASSMFGEDVLSGEPGAETKTNKKRVAWRLLGQAGYDVLFRNLFIRAQRYHLELEPPAGVRFTAANLRRARLAESKVLASGSTRPHVYEKNLRNDTWMRLDGKLVVVDEWVDSAIACTIVACTVLIGIIFNVETVLAAESSSQNVVTLTLLIPSVAMSIVWKRLNWLVSGLHRGLRHAFGLLGLLLFYVALRIALGTPAEECTIVIVAALTLSYATLVLLALFRARFGKFRESGPWWKS